MKHLLLFALVAAVIVAPCAYAQSTPVTSLVSVNVAMEAGLTIQTANAALTSAGTPFADYKGTTSYTYFIRTSKTSGTGTIALKVTTDFSPAGGPSVGTPPSGGDALSYVSTVSLPGTKADGTASTTAATNTATFGADAHSAKAGNSASVDWTLTNDPVYATNAYTATVTWTISAT